jgi:NHS family xanthosine MFS transporter
LGSLVDYIANYWFGTKKWDGTQFGLVLERGIASLFMPTLTGIIADRWINAEKTIWSVTYFMGSFILYIPQVATPETFIYVMLLAMCFICQHCFE